jgi:solute carrier family 35 protein F5
VAQDRSFDHSRSDRHDRQSLSSSRSRLKARGFRANVGLENIGRRALGIFLLLVTVVLWTSSNFLASVRYPSSLLEVPKF